MNAITLLCLMIFIAFISSLITDIIRRFSINKGLFDIPNDRSSHDIPKPKGGGVAIVLTLCCVIALLSFFGKLELDISFSMLAGLCVVSVVGLIDDYKNLSILKRAIAYVIAAMLSILIIGGFDVLTINNYAFQINSFGFIFSTLFVVWLTNLYNFMDGTDGFAAIQTICVGLFAGILLYFLSNTSFAIILFSLVASTVGFLYWNWPPAKIFMGDVGSCTIGFLFGLLSIYTEKKGMLSICVWLILLAPFFGDSLYTLLKRIINREKWYKAHNTHAYQKIYQLGVSHSFLAIGLLLLNLIIVWPLAYVAHSHENYELIVLFLVYCIIGIIWQIVQIKHQAFKSVSQ